MYNSLHHRNSDPKNAQDVNVGLLPIPWLIPMCIFTPCAVGFIIWVVYLYTIKRCKNRKALLTKDQNQQIMSEDVEMQVRAVLQEGQKAHHRP